MICVHNDLTATLDKSHIFAARVIVFDMSKAFDKVDHFTLLKNAIPFIEWIADYLKNRKQCVPVIWRKISCCQRYLICTTGQRFGALFICYFHVFTRRYLTRYIFIQVR